MHRSDADPRSPPRRVELRLPRSVASDSERVDQLVNEVRSDLAPFLRLMRVEPEGTVVLNVELPISHEELSSVVERLARHPLVEQATMRCMVEPKAPHGFPVPPTCERDR